MAYTIRSARTRDVPVIRKLIDANVGSGRLLTKATVTLYEDVQEFCVAELPAGPVSGGPVSVGPVSGDVVSGGGDVAGCGALHVMWEDLAEIRTVAVREDCQGLGIGHAIVAALLRRAREVGVNRVFCLTFAVDFFGRHGFQPISGTPVAGEVYQELLRSYDEGVAEFLDLERVKPNTLGNTRMLLRLLPGLTGAGIQTGIKMSIDVAHETARAHRECRPVSRKEETRRVARSGRVDPTAGSVRRLCHRGSDAGAPGDVTEAPGRTRRTAPIA
jgi:amino-acid N-acetyltransferase